jgi:hypothetical protein
MTPGCCGSPGKTSAKVPDGHQGRHDPRDVALPLGFVDVKVCAVDEKWSGLKLMIRRENRKKRDAAGGSR